MRLTQYVNGVRIDLSEGGVAIEKIAAAVYELVVRAPDEYFLLHRKDSFKVPEKIYGRRHHDNLSSISQIYDSRTKAGKNTGCILSGEPGGGKTLLADVMGNCLIKIGRPVVMITSPVPAEILKQLAKITGPAMFYFDEFEKVYSDIDEKSVNDPGSAQNKLLTYFSENEVGGILNVLTVNGETTDCMVHRPGRMAVAVKVGGDLDDLFSICDELQYTDYMKSMLDDPYGSHNADTVTTIASLVAQFWNPEDPDSDARIKDILRVSNVNILPMMRAKVLEVSVSDSKFIGSSIEVKYIKRNCGPRLTCMLVGKGRVLHRVEVTNPHFLVGGVRVTLELEELPFNADLSQVSDKYVIQADDVLEISINGQPMVERVVPGMSDKLAYQTPDLSMGRYREAIVDNPHIQGGHEFHVKEGY